jgi:16S rRNA (uracil1498-N3)-methyltransferase
MIVGKPLIREPTMRIPRIFAAVPLVADEAVTLPDDAAHRVREVLRLAAGDSIVVFDGAGGEYEARIERITRREVEVRIRAHRDADRESPLRVRIGQGLARGERMDLIVQKATELGVDEIAPLDTERSVLRLAGERAERRTSHWQAIAVHACEQSGRTRIPRVHAPVRLEDWIRTSPLPALLMLSPTADRRLGDLSRPERSVSLLCGPEGGLTPAEESLALAAGFTPVRLGPRILRTETAAVAAVTAIQLLWGDLDRATG